MDKAEKILRDEVDKFVRKIERETDRTKRLAVKVEILKRFSNVHEIIGEYLDKIFKM